ncbi:hypothetical protein E8E14_001083 [Neopestalotiopsis sp. 37M]|nr:hypothetical protein E8E14_001083 [Neopestalotiopsis sp. 37M]
MAPDLVPYVYEQCLGKAQRPSSDVLRKILPQLFSRFDDLQMVVDGIDEVPPDQHRNLIKTLLHLPTTCSGLKLLLTSKLCLSDEAAATRKDHAIMVEGCLRELNEDHNGAIPESVMNELKKDILDKSDGMFLWVNLVMTLLKTSASIGELKQQVCSLPKDLTDL